jgi:hypothetical protein
MKIIRKIIEKTNRFFSMAPTLDFGDSMNFIGRNYVRDPNAPCNVGDKVIIHPVIGKSQATKSYPAVIKTKRVRGQDGKAKGEIWVLVAKGIEDNKDWCGAWMNDYLFSRLEFVCCNYKEKL